jgi:hypothetical protein
VRERLSTHTQSCISTINRTLWAKERTRERGSRDLLIGHFSPFPHHFHPLSPALSPNVESSPTGLAHLNSHPPPTTTHGHSPATTRRHRPPTPNHFTTFLLRIPIFFFSSPYLSPTLTLPNLHKFFQFFLFLTTAICV